VEQRTTEQVEASAALRKQAIERTGQLPLIGDSNMLLIVCTNWHKGRYFELDFSPAVLVSGVPLTERSNKLGRPSYIDSTAYASDIPLRNCGAVLGKDAGGNWWLKWNIRMEAWDNIEKELRAMSGVEIG